MAPKEKTRGPREGKHVKKAAKQDAAFATRKRIEKQVGATTK
jgi:hypothetical protein